MYLGTVSGDDLLFKDSEAQIKAVINGLETKLEIKRGEPPSKNKTIEIKKLEERIYILNAQVEAIRRQNKRKTNRRTTLPKPEKSEPEPEKDTETENDSGSEYEIYFGTRKMDEKKKKSQGSCCGSRPSGKLKKTRKKRKRKQTKRRRKKKKQTRRYKKLK
jgi:hypothetical protein